MSRNSKPPSPLKTIKNRVFGLYNSEPGSDVKTLLSCNSILHLKGVRFELKKGQGTRQCRNCQDFGHAAINCFRKYRCVKCVQEHPHGECTKHPTDNEVACVNCNGNHPANYRGCQVYKDLQKRINDKKKRDREAQEGRQAAFNNFRRQNMSYANVMGSQAIPK